MLLVHFIRKNSKIRSKWSTVIREIGNQQQTVKSWPHVRFWWNDHRCVHHVINYLRIMTKKSIHPKPTIYRFHHIMKRLAEQRSTPPKRWFNHATIETQTPMTGQKPCRRPIGQVIFVVFFVIFVAFLLLNTFIEWLLNELLFAFDTWFRSTIRFIWTRRAHIGYGSIGTIGGDWSVKWVPTTKCNYRKICITNASCFGICTLGASANIMVAWLAHDAPAI